MRDFVCALLGASSLAAASPLPQSESEGILSVPLERAAGTASSQALARRNYYNVEAENEITLYVATLEVGTPPQSVKSAIDTGSRELWFFASSYRAGGFSGKASSTYRVTTKGGFGARYNTESWTAGDWVTDTVRLGGATIENQPFGVVTGGNIDLNQGYFGVGLYNASSPHLNVPAQLRKHGLIARNAFSLYLNEVETTKAGSILFGGVDTAKFDGKLLRVPFHPDEFYGELAFDLDIVIAGTRTSGMFDSGYTFSRLPTSAWKKISAHLKQQIPSIRTDSGGRLFVTDSSKVPLDDYLPITIGGHDFKLPYRELFAWALPDSFYFMANDAKSETNQIVMGNAILRSLYLVYDLEDRVIYVAQAKYTKASNIEPIPAHGLPSKLYYT